MWHKYRAKKQELDGYSFASKLEAAVYGVLKLQQAAGELSDIKVQQHIYLTKARIHYIADFSVFDTKLQQTVWVEAKGFMTQVWPIKKKLFKSYGPGRLRIYKGDYRRPVLDEEIIPDGEPCDE